MFQCQLCESFQWEDFLLNLCVFGLFYSCSAVSWSEYLFSAADPQVKVMVRVCPVSHLDAAESSSFLKVDPRKKQITIMDPSANQTPSASSQKRAAANQVPPKMFNFDAAFPPDASQVRQKILSLEKKDNLSWYYTERWIRNFFFFFKLQIYTKKLDCHIYMRG